MLSFVNIGSDNGLLPGGTKPLSEPVLVYHQGHVRIFLKAISQNFLDIIDYKKGFWNYTDITAISS